MRLFWAFSPSNSLESPYQEESSLAGMPRVPGTPLEFREFRGQGGSSGDTILNFSELRVRGTPYLIFFSELGMVREFRGHHT